jgi:hypothetical protein
VRTARELEVSLDEEKVQKKKVDARLVVSLSLSVSLVPAKPNLEQELGGLQPKNPAQKMKNVWLSFRLFLRERNSCSL